MSEQTPSQTSESIPDESIPELKSQLDKINAEIDNLDKIYQDLASVQDKNPRCTNHTNTTATAAAHLLLAKSRKEKIEKKLKKVSQVF